MNEKQKLKIYFLKLKKHLEPDLKIYEECVRQKEKPVCRNVVLFKKKIDRKIERMKLKPGDASKYISIVYYHDELENQLEPDHFEFEKVEIYNPKKVVLKIMKLIDRIENISKKTLQRINKLKKSVSESDESQPIPDSTMLFIFVVNSVLWYLFIWAIVNSRKYKTKRQEIVKTILYAIKLLSSDELNFLEKCTLAFFILVFLFSVFSTSLQLYKMFKNAIKETEQ